MNRYELLAIASSVLCCLMAAGLGVTWKFFAESDGAVLALAIFTGAGAVTAAAAAWGCGIRRRLAEAAALTAGRRGRAGEGAWGADAQEAALSEERERLAVVRRQVERKLTIAVGLTLAAAAAAYLIAVHFGEALPSQETLELGAAKIRRVNRGFWDIPVRQRVAGGVCLACALVSLTLGYIQRKVGAAEPAGAPLVGDGLFHQVRGLLLLLAFAGLFGDSLDPAGAWRPYRWVLMTVPAVAVLAFGSRAGSIGLLALALLDDVVIVGLAGGYTEAMNWTPYVAWLAVGATAFQAVGVLWKAWIYRDAGERDYSPLPLTQGIVEWTEGRGPAWVAAAMERNFALEVPEAAVKRFLFEHLGAAALAVAVLVYASTCVVVLRPWQRGIRERLGEIVTVVAKVRDRDGKSVDVDVPEVLGPGWHLKLPWPMERIVAVNTDRVGQITYGRTGHDHGSELVMWSEDHFDNEFEMLTGDKSLASVVATLEYRITDPYAYFRNIHPETSEDHKSADEMEGDEAVKMAASDGYQEVALKRRGARHGPEALLAQVGYRALTDVVARNSIWAVMVDDRPRLEAEMKALVQAKLDELRTGLTVDRFTLTDVHPPVKEKTALAFEATLAAMEQREEAIHTAQADVNQMLPDAKGEAARMLADALAESNARTRSAAGEVAAYSAVAKVRGPAGSDSRKLVDQRLLNETRARAMNGRQLYILPPGLRAMLWMGDERTLEDVVAPPPAQPERK